jgi:hypothetical protein
MAIAGRVRAKQPENDQERDPQGDKREKNARENANLHAGKVDGARDPWQGVGRLLGL